MREGPASLFTLLLDIDRKVFVCFHLVEHLDLKVTNKFM